MKRLKLAFGLFICLALYGSVRLYYAMTDDFRPSNFVSHVAYPPLSLNHGEVEEIFAQKFFYLGKGAQSYALESEDGKYILKLFKNKHLRPNKVMQAFSHLPFLHPFCRAHIAKRERKLHTVLNGYQTAYQRHASESGLVYVHLGETKDLKRSIAVEDKLGRSWELALDPVAFVIQEKGVKLRPLLHQLLLEQNVGLALKRIDQVLDLYLVEYDKGICDLDWGVMHNFGFVGEKPIHFDVGKLCANPSISRPENFRGDLEKVAWKIRVWVHRAHPHYEKLVVEEIAHKLTQVLGEPFQVPQVMS